MAVAPPQFRVVGIPQRAAICNAVRASKSPQFSYLIGPGLCSSATTLSVSL
jgi:hypothetical protein